MNVKKILLDQTVKTVENISTIRNNGHSHNEERYECEDCTKYLLDQNQRCHSNWWRMCKICVINQDQTLPFTLQTRVMSVKNVYQDQYCCCKKLCTKCPKFVYFALIWKYAIFAFQPFGKTQILWKFEISLWSNFQKCNCFLPKGMTIKANIGFILHGNLRIFINGRFFEG